MEHARLMVVAAFAVLAMTRPVGAVPPEDDGGVQQQADRAGISGDRSEGQSPTGPKDPVAPERGSPESAAKEPEALGPKVEALPPLERVPPNKAKSGSRAEREPKPGSKEAVAMAQRHFLRALERYRRGDYPAALADLHRASSLDPGSKDLEYNLALVHEKVGQLQDAIAHWKRYQKLESDAEERERAGRAIERLRAVHARQLHTLRPYPRVPGATQGGQSDSQEPGQGRGTLDEWAVGTTLASAAALCVGAVLGVRALTADPDRDSEVRNESRKELEDRAARAHAYALGADLAFAVGVGAGLAAGLFWFSGAEDRSRVSAQSHGSTAARGPGVRFSGEF